MIPSTHASTNHSIEESLDEVIDFVHSPLAWQTLAPRAGGVSDLVDDILLRCQERRVRLTWCPGTVTEHPLDGSPATSIAITLRNSVFRAVMARLAALSDPLNIGSVSPYGGRAEFSYERIPQSRFLVDFVNTPNEQRLELMPIITPAKN